MLNELGQQTIGHGMIKTIDEENLLPLLHKRNYNPDKFDYQIDLEWRAEQPEFYRMMEVLSEKYAIQFANQECIKDTDSYDECLEYWRKRFMFCMAMMYKVISVKLESQWMQNNLNIG